MNQEPENLLLEYVYHSNDFIPLIIFIDSMTNTSVQKLNQSLINDRIYGLKVIYM